MGLPIVLAVSHLKRFTCLIPCMKNHFPGEQQAVSLSHNLDPVPVGFLLSYLPQLKIHAFKFSPYDIMTVKIKCLTHIQVQSGCSPEAIRHI